ncbi:MAG: alpha/beta fold hydrolase [Flavobacteriales bacterium]
MAQELMDAGPFWAEQWAKVERLRKIPVLLGWGMKDGLLPSDLLERWKQALPHAVVRTFPETGHFVHEEDAESLAQAMYSFGRTSGHG